MTATTQAKRSAYSQYTPPSVEVQHQEVFMRDCNGDLCGIDVNIAWLISLMWSKGLETQFCCEGYDWDHQDESDEHSWAASQYRAYILMPWTVRNKGFVTRLLMNFERFEADARVNWDIEFEQSEPDIFGGMNRICLRFPKSDIPLLAEFVEKEH